jgi:hypothetical protein
MGRCSPEDVIAGDEEDAMRRTALMLAWGLPLITLAACATAPGTTEWQGLKAQGPHSSQVMSQTDVSSILQQVKDAAGAGDRAQVLALLQQARASLGTSVMDTGNKMAPLAKHLEEGIGQIHKTNVNLREVATILASQLQDTLKVVQGS